MLRKGLLQEYSQWLNGISRLLDLACVICGSYLGYVIQFGAWELPTHYQIATLFALFLAIIIFSSFGIYKSWRGQGWLHQARMITLSWGSVLIVLVILTFSTKTSVLFSRQWLFIWTFSSLSLLLILRFLLNHSLRVMRASGRNQRRIIIIGAGDLGIRVSRNLHKAAWTGIDIIAFFDDDKELSDKDIDGIKIHSSIEKLAEIIKQNHVEEIWLTLPLRAEKRVKEILHELRHTTLTIRFVPDVFGLQLLNHSMVEVAGLPVFNISESPMYGFNRFIKFLEDKAIAAIILVLISPILVIIAIGVKLSSRGPIFYRQERVSMNGKLFMMLKFRSMPVDSETKTGAVWATQGEARATKFGSFLRRSSLDELPQFYNVLKGNMSIVGPRPERPIFVDKFKDEIPEYMKKHMVKAGITGWAQINGWRGDTDLNKRIEHDIYYIKNWSLWLDIKIIFLTIFKGFIHKNAY